MVAATTFDTLLVLLFFAIAIVFQILTRAAAKTRKRPGDTQPRSTPPGQGSRPLLSEEETDEDRIRKFLEALGQPTTSKPPPPARPRPSYQRPDVLPPVGTPFGSPLPPLKTRPPDLPQQIELPRELRLPQQIPPTRQAKTFQPATPAAPFEIHRDRQPLETPVTLPSPADVYAVATAPAASSVQAKTDLAALLRSTSGLREAIILREIFGPPRSMQPLDLV